MDVKTDRSLRFMETFLYAGTSALLISVPRLHPDYAFVSLFALVPLLWRAIRVGLVDSLVLGALFGALFYFVTAQISPAGGTGVFLPCLPAVIVILSIYCAAVNRFARRIGLNAIFFAILWLPVEYALGYCSKLSGIFVFSDLDSSILVRISSLFGVLMVSFLIILINTLIVVVSAHLGRRLWSRASFRSEDSERVFALCDEASIIDYSYCIPAIRAPPC